jgi:hypothetical protein
MKCFGCGVNKNYDVLEVYPYPEEDRLCDGPIEPLFALEVQPNKVDFDGKWRMTVVCHECFHKIQPDMWIGENCWIAIDPVIPFNDLPLCRQDLPEKWNPKNYE